MGLIKICTNYIRHSWPEKPGMTINRPNGISEYLFLHFWNSFEIELNGKIITTKPHACIIYKKGTPQNYHSNEASTHDWFRMVGNVEELLKKYNLECNVIYYPKNYSFITSLVRKMEVESTTKNKYHTQLCDIYINELLTLLSREVYLENTSNTTINPQTKEQLKHLRLQLSLHCDKRWNISSMAKLINLSSSYLFASYKKYYGVSPMQDLIAIRMQHALTLLNGTNKTINEISEELGYPNSSRFIKQFTKNVGISPNKYRQSNQTSPDEYINKEI